MRQHQRGKVRFNWLETGALPFGFGLSYPTDYGDTVAQK